jgi:hypothetical protein
MRGLGGLAPRGGRLGRVLPEVVLDHQLELHEALAALVLLAHEELLPSRVLELELQADILGRLHQRLGVEGLLVLLDLHVLEYRHDLALLPRREQLLLPRRFLPLRLALLLSCRHLYYRQVKRSNNNLLSHKSS